MIGFIAKIMLFSCIFIFFTKNLTFEGILFLAQNLVHLCQNISSINSVQMLNKNINL